MNKISINQIKTFLMEDIWRITEDEISKKRNILYNTIKIITLTIREFIQGRVINNASALTYSTLLAIIPILAILFAIARGFGLANLLEEQLRSGLEGQALAAETILSFIDSYLSHAKNGVFIGVGIIMSICAPFIPNLYNTTDFVKELASKFLIVSAIMLPFNAFANSTYFTLRSGGLTGVTFIFDSGYKCFITLPIALVLTYATSMPIIPLYAICLGTDLFKCILGFIFIKSDMWLKNLTTTPQKPDQTPQSN
jgi:hypothetical protein